MCIFLSSNDVSGDVATAYWVHSVKHKLSVKWKNMRALNDEQYINDYGALCDS